MAGTARAGEGGGAAIFNDMAADFIGHTPMEQVVFRQWTTGGGGNPGFEDPFRPLAAGGTRTNTNAAGNAKVNNAWVGESEARGTSFSIDWHERVHLLPRTKVDFGNIITLEQVEFELFNAYRDTTVTLTLITNNVSPGIEFPSLAAPASKGHQSSYLDPTSTTQSTTALGTMVKMKVNATQTGLPVFDGTVDFLFDDGDELSLLLAGIRIVFIPFEYEAPTTEVLGFLTDIIESLNGKEQRLALRKQARQGFAVEYALDANDRQRMMALLLEWTDRTFGFPLWHEMLETTAAVSAGATVYQVANADDVDFRVGGLAVAFTNANTYDVLNITAVTATTITAADPSVNAYPKGTRIIPLRLARITGAVSARRFVNNLEVFRVEFEVVDNDTGTPTASTAGWSTYNGRVLLDDCNATPEEMGEQFNRRLFVIDNQTGVVNVRTPWDRSKRSHQKGFVARNRADILKLRRLLSALRGRQKAFYIPTFFDDLTVVATLTIGTSTMDVDNIEYSRFVGARDPMRIFKITFTDGTSLVRIVQSSAKISNTVERLTLDTTWPATRTVAEIRRVQFYELVRFDTDQFTITYPRIGLATLQAPVRAVFDDNP
jgi:hypothetical protein